MEIYKLSDEISDAAASNFVITDIRQGVKNPNRVNIFINDKYAFSLDISQIVDCKLKVGLKISEEELVEYKKASEFGKLYQRALEWVLVRPRSEKELYDYLYKKIYEKKIDKNYINTVIDRLKNKKYVDDAKFARYYVENRFVKKGISRKRLKMELMKKGISKEIIDEVVDARDDEEEILKIIAKKRTKYDNDKLIQYLCRQGFSYQLAQSLVTRETD
ncbi:RecX family transcriptional regulator [Candidatus Saccharibacteria bacterium]|nr:RecX family transcriptional regulator [Candidatus Saccharibacteria bacterium]